MKNFLIAGLMVFALQGAVVHAADEPLPPQQQRMKDCNAEAKSKALKGDERKAFMKACLSGGSKSAEAKPAADKKTQ